MVNRKNSKYTTFIERIFTATVITLLLVGYQKFFSVNEIAPSLILDAELETFLE